MSNSEKVAALIRKKSILISRDLSAATGNVSYTGFGFTPTSIEVRWTMQTAPQEGHCVFDAVGDGVGDTWTTTWYPTVLVDIYVSGGRQHASLASFDADGCTLAWTKTSSPTGTVNMVITAYR